MLKIWGRTNSVNVQKVMWCVGELRLGHERIDAGMAFGKNNEDWFLALNPNGRVPLIDDEGFTLWESNSIVRYLAAKHDLGGLYPESLTERADAERWMDWLLTVLNGPMTVVFWNLVRTPEGQRDMAQVAQGVKESRAAFAMLDKQLSGRDYVLGEQLTMADIPVGAMTYRWYAMPEIERPDLPNLQAWYERLSQRPAFRQHVMLPLT